jgi:hypothetical protein
MTRSGAALAGNVTIPLRAVLDDPALALEVVPETLRPGALDLPVRWAHVSELRDPAPFLLGDELLLTAGVNLPVEPGESERYVRGLRDAGITALGFGRTPALYEELPDTLRSACARYGLPLLVIPVRTPFLAVNRSVAIALSKASQRDQRRIAEAREVLTRAAASGVGAVTRGLAERLTGWAALLDSNASPDADQVPAAAHGAPRPLPPEIGELVARLRAGSGIRSATTELADGTFVLAQPVYPQATASHQLVVGRGERFDDADRAIVAAGAALLGLTADTGAGMAALGSAATSLLVGEAAPDAVLAGLFGAGRCHVVAGVAHRRGLGEAERGYDWLRWRLGTPLVDVTDGPRFTAIVADPPAPEELESLRGNGWLAVVSRPVDGPGLAGVLPEVNSLLQRAIATGGPLGAEHARGLSAVVPPEAAAAFAAAALEPLRGDGELVDTLRAWLANHGSWDRTATALGVHRNSVRHRMSKVERLLDVNLGDPEVRMELWFALRWASTT